MVDKAHRKQGLGQQLVKLVIKKLQTLGATYIPIAVGGQLISFYKGCGFKKTDQVPMSINI